MKNIYFNSLLIFLLLFPFLQCGKKGIGFTQEEIPPLFDIPLIDEKDSVETAPPITSAFPVGGSYLGTQQVALEVNKAANIYYTTDGSEPTVASNLYSTPVNISASTTLKFFSRDFSNTSEAVQTQVYEIEQAIAYNQVYMKNTHNTYERKEGVLDQLIFHRVRSLEFDIHIGKTSWSAVAGNWYVYHADIIANSTTCHRLSDCLEELRIFNLMMPQHEVVTVYIDLKDDFAAGGHQPTDLDNRILEHISAEKIVKPSDLLAQCSSATNLKEAVTGSCAWPYLQNMRGKFLFVLTGGNLCHASQKLNVYTSEGANAHSRIGFVSPDVNSDCTWSSYQASKPYAIFLNMNYDYRSNALSIFNEGLVSRIYYGGIIGGLDQQTHWNTAKAQKPHFLATNKVNYFQDSWAITHTSGGWPFRCFTACDEAKFKEVADLQGIDVDSEDIWGSSDNFYFRYETNTADSADWSGYVVTPNSHADAWAKGCLMVRENTSAGSPYFAVCRPLSDHVIRVQYRSSSGGSSDRVDSANVVPNDTVDKEMVTFVRLRVYNQGKCAEGYASRDGQNWVSIHSRCFTNALSRQGIAASSHGSPKTRFLFGNLKKDTVSYNFPKLPSYAIIGTVRSIGYFNGPMP